MHSTKIIYTDKNGKKYELKYPIIFSKKGCEHTRYQEKASALPTCTEQGYSSYTCRDCGHIYFDYVAALGHDCGKSTTKNEATCVSNGYNECECLRCKETYTEEIKALGHNWGEGWYTVIEPTETTEGLKRRECQREGCNVYEEIILPVIEPFDYSLFVFVRQTGLSVYRVKAAEGVELPQVLKIPNTTKDGRSVVKIAEDGFSENIYLNEVVIPEGILEIGRGAFFNCIMLGDTLRIPASVEEIDSNAFGQCSGIRYLIFEPRSNNTTLSIDGAFSYCSGLEEINIPAFVTYISPDAFEGCYFVKSITVDENNPKYRSENNCLIDKTTNEIIFACKNSIIPKTVSAIGGGSFYGGKYYAPIKIPMSIKTIGSNAFGGEFVTVYCAAPIKPEGWADDWCDEKVTVVWGYTEQDAPSCTEQHTWTLWKPISSPTCNEGGVSSRYCSVCGLSEMKKLDALGHLWKGATCTEPKTCRKCGVTEGEALGHSWSDWEIVIPPECEIDGQQERICSRCGEIETAFVKSEDHDWDVEVEVVEPTCTEDGYTVHKCNNCGDTYKDNFAGAIGHNMVNGVCTRCGYCEKKGVVYYGISAVPETYNSAFILGLENYRASNSHLSSINTKPLANEYIYYCAPTSFGECAFMFNNFVGGFTLIETISFTNAGGKTEAYNIYKSNQANLGVNGAITITIKEMG